MSLLSRHTASSIGRSDHPCQSGTRAPSLGAFATYASTRTCDRRNDSDVSPCRMGGFVVWLDSRLRAEIGILYSASSGFNTSDSQCLATAHAFDDDSSLRLRRWPIYPHSHFRGPPLTGRPTINVDLRAPCDPGSSFDVKVTRLLNISLLPLVAHVPITRPP